MENEKYCGKILITISAEDGQLLYGSPAFVRQFGYSETECYSTKSISLIHPDDKAVFAEKRNKIMKTPGASFTAQIRLQHKDGHWIWIETTLTNLLNWPGINGLAANFRDITENKLEIGDLVIDREAYLVYQKGEKVVLAKKEFELLYLLASKPGKVYTREVILKNIWEDSVVVTNRTIDVHIRKLREKLGDDCVATVKGVGYKFEG